MKYNCPICGTEMSESNFCSLRFCNECQLSIDVKVLDTIAVSATYIVKLEQREEQLVNGWRAAEDRYEARIAELEKELEKLRVVNLEHVQMLITAAKECEESYNAGMRAVLDKQR